VPVLALTATATQRVADDIVQQLGMRGPESYQGSFFRPNLIITSQKKGDAGPPRGASDGVRSAGARRNTRRDILGIIRRHAGESGIVYCLSRRAVDSLADWLAEHGVRALAYHAGLSDEVRHRNQDAFARDECDVIVATVAFGMASTRATCASSSTATCRRAWRPGTRRSAGRAATGWRATAVLLYSWADVMGYEAFLDGIEDPLLRAETRAKTVEMFRSRIAAAAATRRWRAISTRPSSPAAPRATSAAGRGSRTWWPRRRRGARRGRRATATS